MAVVLHNYNRFMDEVDDFFYRNDLNLHLLDEELMIHCPMVRLTKNLADCLHWLPDQGSPQYVNLILYYFYRYGDEDNVFSEDDLRIFYTHLAYNAHFWRNIYGRPSEALRKVLLDYKPFDQDDTDYESE